jgi:hypothetical protein
MAGPYPPDPPPAARERESVRDLAGLPPFLRDRAGRSPRGRHEGIRGQPVSHGRSNAGGDSPNADPAGDGPPGRRLDPASLPLPTMSRRRLATIAGVLAAGWLIVAFGRQVGDASAASNRADDLRAGNAALRQDVATLQDDLARVQDPRFVLLQGRAFGLGGPHEIPFTLAADAAPLASDAPGSASVRLGAALDRRSPLEVWLSTLFGGAR